MPAYEYQARRANGETVKSVAFGKSEGEVVQRLAQYGLRVESIQNAYAAGPAPAAAPQASGPVAAPAAVPMPQITVGRVQGTGEPPTRHPIVTHILGPLVGRVPLRDLSFFFRQFALMLEAGVPMVHALDTLAGQSRGAKFRTVLRAMRESVLGGNMISRAMERYPEVFSPLMLSLIRAGEEGGFLPQTLRQAADYLDHEIELRNMYKRETFMPKLYVFASIVIILIANAIIASVSRPGTNTPRLWSPLTERETWEFLAPYLIFLFLFFRVGLAMPPIRLAWDAFLLYVPYLGKTLHHFAMSKFGQAFSALYKGGVPITRTIDLSADACGNEWLRMRIKPAARVLESGAGIYQTLASTGAFNPIVLNMVATGESTGNLDLMLSKMAEFYEGEAKVRAKQLANVVGVVVLLAVGAYIGYIVITFYTGFVGSQIQEATR